MANGKGQVAECRTVVLQSAYGSQSAGGMMKRQRSIEEIKASSRLKDKAKRNREQRAREVSQTQEPVLRREEGSRDARKNCQE